LWHDAGMSMIDKNNDISREDFFHQLKEMKERFEAMSAECEVTVRDPEHQVEGYAVVWNTKISHGGPLHGCGKGGTRLSPTLTLDEVKMLAKTMALKNAAAGLPLGGSKSGLRADPNAPDFEMKYRKFVKLCQPFLFENGGSFGGFGFDIGANPIHAVWACDALGSTRSFTGKTAAMGGTDYDRNGIAGLGVATAAKAMIEEKGETAKGISFAVQGAGAMGGAVIRYFAGYGGVLKALADLKFGGSWAFPNGASDELIAALSFHETARAMALIEAEGRKIDESPQSVLFADVDVLFPCAIQNVITETNSYDIKARYISEGANQPVTKEAYTLLFEKKINIVPDFIANPGGVIAAFVELTSKGDDKAREAMDYTIEKITANVKRLHHLCETYGVEPVHAGQFIALSNIFYGLDKA